jgi:hypothetical protein
VLIRLASPQTNVSVAVAPTKTVVLPPTSLDASSVLICERTNQDLSQVLNEQIEVIGVSGNWSVLSDSSLQGIQPGETRIRALYLKGYTRVRTTATASGSGLALVATTTAYSDESI